MDLRREFGANHDYTPAMSSSRDIRVVCFDLGGVVVRIPQSWEEACAVAGLPVHSAVTGPRIRGALTEIAEAYQVGKITHAEFVARSSNATGGLYSEDDVQTLHDAWLLGEYPGMEEIIRQINQGGRAQTACLSNTEDGHWNQLIAGNGRLEFPAFLQIQHKFASHLMGVAKPDPRIYRMVEDELGVSGRQILFFDDREENLEAAAARGWISEWLDAKGDPSAVVAAVLFRDGILKPR